ncbi:GNAT family N-acetyltransferase [Streptomyces thermocarboxydus]
MRPLLRELGDEYSSRYGRDAHAELTRYPDEEFTAPHGGVLLLLLERGEPVAGGAFRRYDPHTAELKRIWTHSAHRRRPRPPRRRRAGARRPHPRLPAPVPHHRPAPARGPRPLPGHRLHTPVRHGRRPRNHRPAALRETPRPHGTPRARRDPPHTRKASRP